MQPIIKNMPIPPMKRRGAKSLYPWKEIQPGQAFKFNDTATMSGATSLAYQSGKQHQKKFAVRQMDDGIWCWRVDGTPYEVQNGNYRQPADLILDYARKTTAAQETAVVGHQSEEPDAI